MSSEANDPVVVEKNLAMRARDGVTLFADVYRARPVTSRTRSGAAASSSWRTGSSISS